MICWYMCLVRPCTPQSTATPEEGYALIRALGKKHQLDLPKECPPALHKLIPNWITPGAAEAIAIKVYRCVRTAGDPAPDAVTALAESLKDYQNPVPPEVMRLRCPQSLEQFR